LPEETATNVVLSLQDPFPIDWMWPDDYQGSYDRFLQTADRLNETGDYAIFFQTSGYPTILDDGTVPPAGPDSPLYHYFDAHQAPLEVYQRLHGRRIACGTYVVVYSPAR